MIDMKAGEPTNERVIDSPDGCENCGLWGGHKAPHDTCSFCYDPEVVE